MHVLLTGATGLVGSAALDALLNASNVTRISILSRRPVPMVDASKDKAKVKVFIHEDFGTYDDEILRELKGAEACIWALGRSQNGVEKSEYIRITQDWPLAAARQFATLSPTFNFVYVSGEMTTTTPTRFTPFFGVIKGRAEAALLELHKSNPAFRPYSIRPAAVDPAGHSEIQPWIPKQPLAASVPMAVLGPVFRRAWKSMMSPTRDLGRVMVQLATGDGGPIESVKGDVTGEGRTLSNVAFRRLAGI